MGGVSIAGNIAYAVDELLGLCVIDITDPRHPRITGGAQVSDACTGICATDECLCLTTLALEGTGSGLVVLPVQCDH